MKKLSIAAAFVTLTLTLTGGNVSAGGTPALLGTIDATQVQPLADPTLRGERFEYQGGAEFKLADFWAKEFCQRSYIACGGRITAIPRLNSNDPAAILQSYRINYGFFWTRARYANY